MVKSAVAVARWPGQPVSVMIGFVVRGNHTMLNCGAKISRCSCGYCSCQRELRFRLLAEHRQKRRRNLAGRHCGQLRPGATWLRPIWKWA